MQIKAQGKSQVFYQAMVFAVMALGAGLWPSMSVAEPLFAGAAPQASHINS